MSDPEYLVHFGLGAFLGRFRAPAADAFDRDCRVVVQTARGLELGVVRDPGRVVELWGRACSGGSASACAELASMYEAGRGVRRDREQAAVFVRRACDAGVAPACVKVR